MSPLPSPIKLHFQTTLDPISFIFMFNMSEPSQSTLHNHKDDWFGSQQFSAITFFFLSFNANPCIQLMRYHISIFIFISILSSFSSCFVFIVFVGEVTLPYTSTIHNYYQQASYVAHRIVAKLKLGRKLWPETIPNQTQLLKVLKDKWLVSEDTLRRSHSQPDSFRKLKTLSA